MHRRGDQGRIAGADSEVTARVVDSAGVGVENALSECLHTISGTQIERGESFGDEGGEKLIKSAGVGVVISTALECRIRVEVGVRAAILTE